MADILQDTSEEALIGAIQENGHAFFTRMWGACAARLGDEVTTYAGPELNWMLTDNAFAYFNVTWRIRLSPERADAQIEAMIACGKARGVSLLWWTGPSDQPSDLGERLLAHGFHQSDTTGMAVDLQELREEGIVPKVFTIEQVRDADTLRAYVDVLGVGFGFPGYATDYFYRLLLGGGAINDPMQRYYLGRLAGKPVATSLLFYGAGVAGIYNVATLPEARRRGIGAAITLKPLLEARDEGYRVSILQASGMGLNVYRRLGYQAYCNMPWYVWQNAA